MRFLTLEEEEKMEIPIRAKVLCKDGPGGEATHVIVHPATKKVTRLVVKERRSPHVERLVPFRFVKDATDEQIRLCCSRQELSGMQTYLKTKFVEADDVQYERGYAGPEVIYNRHKFDKVEIENIPEDELAVDTGTKVRSADGPVGRIDELMVDPTSGSITHLRLRKGRMWAPKQVTVPVSEVDHIGDRGVRLRMNRAGIEALPATAARRR
jgi:hypothetical protein